MSWEDDQENDLTWNTHDDYQWEDALDRLMDNYPDSDYEELEQSGIIDEMWEAYQEARDNLWESDYAHAFYVDYLGEDEDWWEEHRDHYAA